MSKFKVGDEVEFIDNRTIKFIITKISEGYLYDNIGIFGHINNCNIVPKQTPDKPKRYAEIEIDGKDVIDLVKHWNLNFNEGNILKYLLRNKGQRESDLKKIADYANRELTHIKNK